MEYYSERKTPQSIIDVYKRQVVGDVKEELLSQCEAIVEEI